MSDHSMLNYEYTYGFNHDVYDTMFMRQSDISLDISLTKLCHKQSSLFYLHLRKVRSDFTIQI